MALDRADTVGVTVLRVFAFLRTRVFGLHSTFSASRGLGLCAMRAPCAAAAAAAAGGVDGRRAARPGAKVCNDSLSSQSHSVLEQRARTAVAAYVPFGFAISVEGR